MGIDTPETCTPALARKVGLNRILKRTRRVVRDRLYANHDSADSLVEGGKVKGAVHTLREHGAFIEICGGICGFMRKSNMSWRHSFVVSDLLVVGDEIEVVVLSVDSQKGRISLGMKQLQQNPFDGTATALTEGKKVTGTVHSLLNYGALVELCGGICGLLHIHDISWRQSIDVPEVLAVGDEIEVVVLEVDSKKERISLGMKQLQPDPFENFPRDHPVGSRLMGQVVKVVDFGLYVESRDGVQGLVHRSEISWKRKKFSLKANYKRGDEIEVMVLDIDRERRRVALSIKQCLPNPWQDFAAKYCIGDKVKGIACAINEHGMFVELPGEIEGLVRHSEVPGGEFVAYNSGQEVEVIVLSINAERERIGLGIEPLAENTDTHNENTNGV